MKLNIAAALVLLLLPVAAFADETPAPPPWATLPPKSPQKGVSVGVYNACVTPEYAKSLSAGILSGTDDATPLLTALVHSLNSYPYPFFAVGDLTYTKMGKATCWFMSSINADGTVAEHVQCVNNPLSSPPQLHTIGFKTTATFEFKGNLPVGVCRFAGMSDVGTLTVESQKGNVNYQFVELYFVRAFTWAGKDSNFSTEFTIK